MNKSAIYTALLFGFIGLLALFASYTLGHHEIALEKNGLQFVKAGKAELIESNAYHPVVFIITDEAAQEKRLYKTDPDNGSTAGAWLLHRSKDMDLTNKDLFIASISKDFVFQETLKELTVGDKIELVGNASNIEGMHLLQYTAESGFFGFLDDSAFIFFVLALLAFFLIWGIDFLGFLAQQFIHPSMKTVLHLLCLVGAVVFFNLTNFATWIPTSSTSILVRNVLVLVLGYALFQFVLKRFIPTLDFLDGELVKFATLFFGLGGLFFLGNFIGYTIDTTISEGVILPKPLKAGSHVAIGLMFAFTMGNLLNNIRKRWLYLRANNRLLKQSKQDSLQSKAELEALQSSINPHFLYNSLNSIASLAKTDAEKTEQMALSLSAFYQYVTNKKKQPTSSLAQELEMIQHYLNIEKIRFGNRLQVIVTCSDAALACHLPRFTLQPLIENAIKYGFQKDKIEVKIAAEKQANDLHIQVFDSGKPFPPDLAMGFGLQNVSKKLRLLFPEQHRLEFVNEPQKHVFIRVVQK